MSAAVIIAGVAVFVTGAVAGIMFIVSTGIQREERVFRKTGAVSLTRLAPDRVSQGTRGLVGLTVRQRAGLDPAAESIRRQQENLIRNAGCVTAALADSRHR